MAGDAVHSAVAGKGTGVFRGDVERRRLTAEGVKHTSRFADRQVGNPRCLEGSGRACGVKRKRGEGSPGLEDRSGGRGREICA